MKTKSIQILLMLAALGFLPACSTIEEGFARMSDSAAEHCVHPGPGNNYCGNKSRRQIANERNAEIFRAQALQRDQADIQARKKKVSAVLD